MSRTFVWTRCLALIAGVVFAAAEPGEKPPFYPDKTKLLVYRDAQGNEHPVKNPADWAIRRRHILANMQQVMGPLPDPSRKVPLDVRVTEERDDAR